MQILSLIIVFNVFDDVCGQELISDEIKNTLMEIMATICDTSVQLPADKAKVVTDCEDDIPRVVLFTFIYHRCIRQSMDIDEFTQPFPCYRLMPGNDKLQQCMDKWARR
ncbi:unnamed protein product, partial [Medioppia subpectinata]